MDVRTTRSGEHAGPAWLQVTPGVHRAVDAEDAIASTLAAWQAVLSHRACFTHVTAAQLWGLWLPRLPEGATVVAQVPIDAHPVRRQGLRVLRVTSTADPVDRFGLRVAPVGEVLLSLCRDLADLDALIAVDAALHLGLASEDELRAVADVRRRGATRLRRVLERADGRSESPWETLLREFHRVVEAPVTPQVEVRDAHGAFVARGDLHLVGTRVLHEYDGHHHLEVTRQRSDLRRSRRLEATGWVRRGYSSQDLLHRAAEVLADIGRSLARPHDRRRLRPWWSALRGSSLTTAGSSRLWSVLAG